MLYRRLLLIIAAISIRIDAITKFIGDRFVFVRRWWQSRNLHPCPQCMTSWFAIVTKYPFRYIAWFISELLPCFRYCLRPPPAKGTSRIVLHQANFGRRFPSNRISNTKYTVLSFVTLNLFEQFRLPLNQYFLLVALLQFVDAIAPQSPLTTLTPLLLAFALTMIKEIGDDFRRRRQDRIVNYRPYLACQGACAAMLGASPIIFDDDSDSDDGLPQARGSMARRPAASSAPKGRARAESIVPARVRWPAPPSAPPRDFSQLFGVWAWVRGRRNTPNPDGTLWLRSMDLLVGDVVVVHQGQEVPCDLFLIASSDPCGSAFIETAQLDGETDFKPRSAVPLLNAAVQSGRLSPLIIEGVHLQCEAPNPRLDSFTCTLEMTDADGKPCSVPVGAENLLPQSTVLKNTEYVYGLVVYTGPETKVGLSRATPPAKLSQLDRKVSQYAVFVFLFQVSTAVALGLLGMYKNYSVNPWYLNGDDGTPGWRPFIYIGRFFLLTSAMIPISFKMLVDVCKFMIGRFIGWDAEMTYVDPETGHKEPAVATSTAIAEDLGQVDVVLSDKTGTLTLNQLIFAGAGVDGDTYLALADDPLWGVPALAPKPVARLGDRVQQFNPASTRAAVRRNIRPSSSKDASPSSLKGTDSFHFARGGGGAGSPSVAGGAMSSFSAMHMGGTDSSMRKGPSTRSPPHIAVPEASSATEAPSNGGVAAMYVRALLLCNTVTPASGEGDGPAAVSPDEIALVDGAESFGGRLIARSRSGLVTIQIGAHTEYWRVIREFPFSSERKRMSTLVVRVDPRNDNDETFVRELDPHLTDMLITSPGCAILFSKGSDDVLLPRCNRYVTAAGEMESMSKRSRRRTEIKQQVSTYAATGLRTLVFAAKPMGKSEVEAMQNCYAEAGVLLGGARAQRYLELDDVSEAGLAYVGTSAILDKLQPHVPETIAALQSAGIVVWMLTGDKLETARQIAYACHLLNDNDTVLTVKGTSEGAVLDSLLAIKRQVTEAHPAASLGVVDKEIGYDDVPQFQAARLRAAQKQRAMTYARSMAGGPALAPATKQTAIAPLWRDDEGFGPTANADIEDASTIDSEEVPQPRQPGFCLLVSGEVLEFCVTGAARSAFLLVTRLMRSVVCCRATPSLKGEVTSLLKATGLVTLAIGDGGNDVLMIQTAHIGVGIAGRDGRQAARAADFTIARFGFLRELLLVHGTYSYNRTSYVVRYSFYKSGLLVFAQVVYNFFAQWSGQGFWDTYQVMMWNATYTSIPSLAMVFDRILPRDWLIAVPEIYANSQRGRPMAPANFFIGFCGRGLFHAILLVVISAYVFEEKTFVEGRSLDRGTIATAAYTVMLAVQVVIIITESHMMTTIQHLSVWVGCVLVYVVTMYMATKSAWEVKMRGGFAVMDVWMDDQFAMMIRPVCVFGMILTFVLLVLPHIVLHAWRINFRPTPLMTVKKYISQRGDV